MSTPPKFKVQSLSKKSIVLGALLGAISGIVFGTFLFQRATSGVIFGVAMFITFTLALNSSEKKK